MVSGDLSNPPASLGEHFNPHGKKHGSPASNERHVGSLGNIEANADGMAKYVSAFFDPLYLSNKNLFVINSVNISDTEVKLIGPLSICGRSLAVHINEDDFGLGGSEYSLVNGNAGPVIGCGVVGISTS